MADGTYLPLARDTQWRARAHSPRRGLRAPGLGQYHASDASDYWQAPARAAAEPRRVRHVRPPPASWSTRPLKVAGWQLPSGLQVASSGTFSRWQPLTFKGHQCGSASAERVFKGRTGRLEDRYGHVPFFWRGPDCAQRTVIFARCATGSVRVRSTVSANHRARAICVFSMMTLDR